MSDLWNEDPSEVWAEPDEAELKTNGRIYEGPAGELTCANCGSTNIKTSQAGNLYCADLCWVEDAKKAEP